MTRSGFEYILAKHVFTAARKVPSIAAKSVSPHVLRHTCAMHILQATHDVRKVSVWLGHACLHSTGHFASRCRPPWKSSRSIPCLHSDRGYGQPRRCGSALATLSSRCIAYRVFHRAASRGAQRHGDVGAHLEDCLSRLDWLFSRRSPWLTGNCTTATQCAVVKPNSRVTTPPEIPLL